MTPSGSDPCDTIGELESGTISGGSEEDRCFYATLMEKDYDCTGMDDATRLLIIAKEISWAESQEFKQELYRNAQYILNSREIEGWEGVKISLAGGWVYLNLGMYSQAIDIIRKGIDISSAMRCQPLLAWHLHLRGLIYRDLGQNRAMDDFKKAYSIFASKGNQTGMTIVAIDAMSFAAQRPELWPEEMESFVLRHGSKYARGLGFMYRGEMLLNSGDIRHARADVRKAIRMIRSASGRSDRFYIHSAILLLKSYVLEGKEKRVKRLLLDIVTTLPVKQYHEEYIFLKDTVWNLGYLREDPETAILFEKAEKKKIRRHVLEAAIQEARMHYPQEFGALLKGIDIIEDMLPVPTLARDRRSVLFQLYYDPFGHQRVEGDGVIHSHPSGSARPSKADLYMFSHFPGVNIIIAYPYTMDSWAAYDSRGNRIDLEVID